MRTRRRLAAALVLMLLIALPLAARAEGLADIHASGAALFVVDGSRQLYGLHEHDKLPMASTTKIMTALIAIERCHPSEMVAVPDEAVGTEGSSIYLARGETMSMQDLLHGLMLTSGNDAAVAIAIHVAGSVETFAALMNARAKELGCENTNFVTPNGLHDKEHYTSAYDLGLIACEAMRNEVFRSIVSTSYYKTGTGDTTRTLKNKNRVLWEYEGGNGVKTGFTKVSGRCLVFSAERDGVMLVGVVLNCPDMWANAYEMLDAGFEMTERKTMVSAELPIGTVAVQKSLQKSLAVYPERDILVTVKSDGSETIEWEVSMPPSLPLPVSAGDKVGTLKLYIDGKLQGETPLIVTESAVPLTIIGWLKMVIESFAA